jgi:hypothetical protein
MSELEEKKAAILERFKALRVLAKSDIKFDKANFDKQFDTSEKVGKWIDKRYEWNSLCRSYEYKRNEAWKKAYEYYRTDYPIKIDNKEEYKNLIATDPAYHEIADMAHLVSDIVDFIDATILNLKARSFEMQNFQQWIKFCHGG